MKTPAAPVSPFIGLLAAISLAGALAGCSLVSDTVRDEVDSAVAEPDTGDVAERFDAMAEIPGDPAGVTEVEVAGPGTLWALTRRDDVPRVAPGDCAVDGEAMGDPAEDLNVPEPDGLAAGDPQTLFAFASAAVDRAGGHTVTCDLGDAQALLLLFEPGA